MIHALGSPIDRSQATRPLVCLLLFTTVLAVPCAGSEVAFDGPVVPHEGPVLVHNSQLLYTGEDQLQFSTPQWLERHSPGLLPLRPAIDTWAANLAVHPRVLSALLHDVFDGTAVAGSRSDMDIVVRVASALATVFHQELPNELAASHAVATAAAAVGVGSDLDPSLALPRDLARAAEGTAPLLFGYFQPPWEIGDTWAGGGAHGDTGSGLRNALDFWGEFRNWGSDLSQWWVSAMQAGTLRVWASCSMSIIHGNGWVTSYYHLEDIQLPDMAVVERNDRLSHYANDEAQALCQGGSSTGPHVHVAVTYNGQRVEIDESNLDFTAFSHHVGIGQYDFDCATSWYNHFTLGQVCPGPDQLLNDAALPGNDLFADGFESGSTSAWDAVTR